MSKIIGRTTSTTMPRSDWNQIDETKADFIKNKPELGSLASKDKASMSDIGDDVIEKMDEAKAAVDELSESLNINYDELSFDVTEIVIDTSGTSGLTTSMLGQAILGRMILA